MHFSRYEVILIWSAPGDHIHICSLLNCGQVSHGFHLRHNILVCNVYPRVNTLSAKQNGLQLTDIFKYIFLNEDFRISIEICFLASNWRYVSIGSNNGLAPSSWQAVICSNGDSIPWHRYVSPDLKMLQRGEVVTGLKYERQSQQRFFPTDTRRNNNVIITSKRHRGVALV